MIIFVTFLYVLASTCSARPEVDINPQNVVTVPPNCPDGQAWVNGACRDVWRVAAAPANMVTAPPNCRPGQVYVNGQCRDVWIKSLIDQSKLGGIQSNYDYAELAPQNVVTAPPNCRPGQQWINGSCRDVWKSDAADTKNVVTVPPNCPEGQEYVNGQCREVWRRSPNFIENYIHDLKNRFTEGRLVENAAGFPDQDDSSRNVISVPNQCPVGYKPDALGNCREIFM